MANTLTVGQIQTQAGDSSSSAHASVPVVIETAGGKSRPVVSASYVRGQLVLKLGK